METEIILHGKHLVSVWYLQGLSEWGLFPGDGACLKREIILTKYSRLILCVAEISTLHMQTLFGTFPVTLYPSLESLSKPVLEFSTCCYKSFKPTWNPTWPNPSHHPTAAVLGQPTAPAPLICCCILSAWDCLPTSSIHIFSPQLDEASRRQGVTLHYFVSSTALGTCPRIFYILWSLAK